MMTDTQTAPDQVQDDTQDQLHAQAVTEAVEQAQEAQDTPSEATAVAAEHAGLLEQAEVEQTSTEAAVVDVIETVPVAASAEAVAEVVETDPVSAEAVASEAVDETVPVAASIETDVVEASADSAVTEDAPPESEPVAATVDDATEIAASTVPEEVVTDPGQIEPEFDATSPEAMLAPVADETATETETTSESEAASDETTSVVDDVAARLARLEERVATLTEDIKSAANRATFLGRVQRMVKQIPEEASEQATAIRERLAEIERDIMAQIKERRTLKEAIVDKAEALSNSNEWKATGEAMRGLFEQWKSIGSAGHEAEDALWKRFQAARDAFSARRNEWFEGRQKEWAGNREKKEALSVRAEELSESTDWRSTADAMGGSASDEFMALSPNGEDTILICPNGDYAANREVARFRRDTPAAEELLPMEDVETPNTPTIEALANLLNVPTSRTAKAVFYRGGSGKFVFAVIRGDLDVNETELRKVAGEPTITPATAEEIRAIGAEPGYGSPVGVKGAFIVVDESIRDSPNLVAGANRPGHHLKNVNLGRDYQASAIGSIAAAEDGYPCPVCGTPMKAERAIEIGNIFKLGTRYSAALGATYLDAEGKSNPIVMGSYGIGSGRAAATIVEQRFDARGIIWPLSVAPFHVSLLSLAAADDTETTSVADRLFADLTAAGVEVLYDDRPDRPGVKFNDADLIGNPLRVSVSPRTLANGQFEMKGRTEESATFGSIETAVADIQAKLGQIAASERQAAGLTD